MVGLLVGLRVAEQLVVALAACELVRARTAIEFIVAIAAVQVVVAGVRGAQLLVVAQNQVCTGAAMEFVGRAAP